MPKAKHDLSVLEIEKLIELVRGHPCLYDARLADHRDAQLTHNIWKSIANVMGREDIDALEWKKKWRNQRDTYMKKRGEIKSSKSGQAAERAKKWHFFDMLSFLDAFIEENNTDSNVPFVESGCDISLEDQLSPCSLPGSTIEAICPVLPPSPNMCDIEPRVPAKQSSSRCEQLKSKRQKKENESGLEVALQDLIQHHKRTWGDLERDMKDPPVKDGDELFFQSCAERMKMLKPSFRSYLKMQISQLFFNAENPDAEPVPIMPLPPQMATTIFTIESSEA